MGLLQLGQQKCGMVIGTGVQGVQKRVAELRSTQTRYDIGDRVPGCPKEGC